MLILDGTIGSDVFAFLARLHEDTPPCTIMMYAEWLATHSVRLVLDSGHLGTLQKSISSERSTCYATDASQPHELLNLTNRGRRASPRSGDPFGSASRDRESESPRLDTGRGADPIFKVTE